MRTGPFARLAVVLAARGAAPASRALGQPFLTDRFGRDLGVHGVTLVDWDGYLANPALGFDLSPPVGAAFPVSVTLTANGGRLHSDEPSSVGAAGPDKSLSFQDASSLAFRLSIFPDRDGLSESYTLTIQFVDAANHVTDVSIPIAVVDQDVSSPPPFDVTVDFSQDASGFFADATRHSIVAQAANDWTYFFAGMNLDAVSEGQESTFVWSYPLAWTGPPPQGSFHNNTAAFTGFLLYAYGIDTIEVRSGGDRRRRWSAFL